MASYSVLRWVSSSVLPLAGSTRAFRIVVSGALTAEKAHALSRRSFVPTLRFCSASTDKSLIRVLESEIQCAEDPTKKMTGSNFSYRENDDGLPVGSPLQIEDRPRERTVLLTISFDDEIIKVEADIPQIGTEDEDDKKDDIETIPLFVTITQKSGMSLQIGVTASYSTSEIYTDSLAMKQPEVFEDQLAYEGPEFYDLDENLQKAFLKYLAIRGIDFNTFDFMPHHMLKKRHREYFLWLEKIKNFIEKPPHL
ncbi:hypothetical protein FH972_017325 [Carpinus fangiana]|uniref:Mitochondrial glycoprotein n=1 Tax=Carpinus fangiana TaxID=176857 RepID=A0A5N6RJY2_9ROSI|nr:hypothetical protein FH972_017325 [Carpinus fangiana]